MSDAGYGHVPRRLGSVVWLKPWSPGDYKGVVERVKVPFGNGTNRMREHPREQPSFLPALSKLLLDVCKFCEESSHRDYLGCAECLNSVVLAN